MTISWVSVSGGVGGWRLRDGGVMRTLKKGRDRGVGGGEEEDAERGGDGGGHCESGLFEREG